MRYRRNADSQLSLLEREWRSTGNRNLLKRINSVRQRAGLSPHPDARIIFANNALFELAPRFLEQLQTMLDVYDEIDIPMHIYALRELYSGVADYDINLPAGAPQDENTLIALLIQTNDEIRDLEQEYRTVVRASTDFNLGSDFSEEFEELRQRRGVSPITIGELAEMPEQDPEGIYMFRPEQLQRMASPGHNAGLEKIGWLGQLVARKALHLYRKLLTYGMIPVNQIYTADPEMIGAWYDYEISELDTMADQIEIAMNEIIDVTQGFDPSPEAVEMFSSSWYA